MKTMADVWDQFDLDDRKEILGAFAYREQPITMAILALTTLAKVENEVGLTPRGSFGGVALYVKIKKLVPRKELIP